MLPVAILAGGLATRLGSITKTIPKAMLTVSGRPFIAWQLDQLRTEGISDIVLCLGYLGAVIEDYVGSGAEFGLNVTYSYDGKIPLGTGGAIKNALPILGENFFVLYGDSYLPITFKNVEKAYLSSKFKGLITVLANKNKWDKSNVLLEGGKIVEYNKTLPKSNMRHIDYGLGVLSSSSFMPYFKNQAWDLASLYNNLSLMGQLQGYEVYNRFYEIGSHKGLLETANYLRKNLL